MESGTRLAHYEILSPLGKGGIGEVWRARDTKIGRAVAIKTLPEEFAKDADRLARLEREAKLLACRNQPNIAAIYGPRGAQWHTVPGTGASRRRYIRSPIRRGAIPVEEFLKLAEV